MKFRTISVFVLALTLAAGAAWFANRWVQLQVQPASAKDNPTTSIIVAAQTIPLGQKIVDAHLEPAAWPADRVPGEAFTAMGEIKGHVAAQTIYQGEPILKRKIAEHGAGSTLSALITRNKRAVTVRVNDVVGVAGFVLPGNSVDVLATGKGRAGATTTVLQNVKVLAVDQTTGNKDEPTVVRAVTLELTPEEAEELVEARTDGEIQLALRNTLDTEITPEPPAPAEPAAKPRPRIKHITVIRGTAVSEIRQP
jgi:pilus assembly protein CpaB